jgi:hypothetical protein
MCEREIFNTAINALAGTSSTYLSMYVLMYQGMMSKRFHTIRYYDHNYLCKHVQRTEGARTVYVKVCDESSCGIHILYV